MGMSGDTDNDITRSDLLTALAIFFLFSCVLPGLIILIASRGSQ